MLTIRIAAASLLAGAIVLSGAGCGGDSGGQDYAGSTSRGAAGSEEILVPTPEEADAAAAEEIRDQNADEIFEQLDAEINEELEGGG